MEGQELAERHIDLRERVGLTQEQEAKMAGVSPTTISGIESGKIARPHLKTLLKIARALGTDVGELRGPGKAEAPLPDFEDERREDVYGMVLAAARRQAKQDEQAAARTWESERPQRHFADHENEVVVRLLEECARDEVAGTLVEMARRCVQLESQLKQSKEATSAEPARSAAT